MSALGSVFGVNLGHGLEHVAEPWLFWAFLVLAFGLGFVVRASIHHKPGARG